MSIDISKLLCTNCGSRGFKRINKQYDNTLIIPALQCNNCDAIVYEHESMLMIQTHNEQTASAENIT